ncbi:DUF72 domain-containing protein [Methylocaldum szegediense]|uniref:DUF72 domain-containing protein n=1 Tax=Methylocaldum szegediense TaxID=73780 RepID=A0ABN8X4B3_9GAMM|nr:DUF72 domain-containing protein [Methylocaldum szegediense]CAI8861070.1 conserved protein of unknown function [Methylocaldum szegediense]
MILVGTASWADKNLIDSGLFYPAHIKTPSDRLAYYASQFPLVEVDSSYYALPSERNAALWAERTPADFRFDIKSFRLFTQHQTPPKVLPVDIRVALGAVEKQHIYYHDLPEELRDELWQRFRSALRPLKDAGKLGVVLFQFPPWFVFRQSNLEHIAACARMMEGFRVAVEFRHRSWFDDQHRENALEFERRLGLTHVVVDEPQGFASSIPSVWEVTTPEIAVVRLHGRKRETWSQKGLESSAERFNYLYSTDELRKLVGAVKTLASKAREVHVVFNNNFGNFAQRNARDLAQLLLES